MMTDLDAELLERGRRLKMSIDALYTQLMLAARAMSQIKSDILSEEAALRDIQERLLATVGVGSELSAAETLRRKVVMERGDADGLR